jgi:hypothetical protein
MESCHPAEENKAMRKKVIHSDTINRRPRSEEEWLDLEEIARVEVTSEDPRFPIEFALAAGGGLSWRAAEKGEQIIRIVFDSPRTLRRIKLEFLETIVRQQWNFNPQGSTREVEDYQVQLENLSTLELTLKPDLIPNYAFASLAKCCLA